MELFFDTYLANKYNSPSQKARILTEDWMSRNMYCPKCGQANISQFENNRPVADFYCENCLAQYELKSKTGSLSNKIVNGAYHTMIKRIQSNKNPDLFCLQYSQKTQKVQNLIYIPKHFFTTEIIEKRNPLPDTAQRAGWIGCNILIGDVLEQAKIKIVSEGHVVDKRIILAKSNKLEELNTCNLSARGWMLDVLMCINKIKNIEFSLNDMYVFENELSIKHPENNNIRPKIRQQLQFLRDKGYIEFLGNGYYMKII